MIQWWQKMSVTYPKQILLISTALLVLLGIYGAGVFSSLSSSSSDMNASTTQAAETQRIIESKFGKTPDGEIIVFERKDDSLGLATSQAYQSAVAEALMPLEDTAESITSYATTGSNTFISYDETATYAVITLNGSTSERYEALRDYKQDLRSDKLTVSIGGQAALGEETNSTVSSELATIELLSLPVLLILMLVFFRSVVASLVPLGIAIYTIVGAFAISRLLSEFIAIDTYAVNVITILGIGLAIDYALLSVNRFREELSNGTKKAVQTVIATSGRTIAFSGVTVIACLLALLVFPVDIMRSIAIGGASAVAMAVLVTITVLPAALALLGTSINKLSIPTRKTKRTAKDGFWPKVASITTTHPVAALSLGLVVVALSLVPLRSFAPGMMDYNWVARSNESYVVAKKLSTEFPSNPNNITAVLTVDETLTPAQKTELSCSVTEQLQQINGIQNVTSATPVSSTLTCAEITQLQEANLTPATLKAAADTYMAESALQFALSTPYDTQSSEARAVVERLRDLEFSQGNWHIGGEAATFHDNNQLYVDAAPYAAIIVIISMIVLLSLALQSVVVPIQAILTNLIGLALSMAAVVGVFQLGWLQAITGWPQVDGIALAAPILVIAIAFGLAMDYSVFLYARMREVYDKTGDSTEAVTQGIVKTGPIITAAALALFVVVIGFITSSVLFMQIIGLGLAVAVVVDAFFVRLLLVPSIMTLMGKVSWWGPKFLKKFHIKHD